MTHAEFLAQTIAETAEEVPGFELLARRTNRAFGNSPTSIFTTNAVPGLRNESISDTEASA